MPYRTIAYWTVRVTVAVWLVEPAEAVIVTVLLAGAVLFPELEPPQPSRWKRIVTTQRICKQRRQCRHLLRPLSSPPNPNRAKPQTISGEAEPHIPGRPCNEDDAAVWIVSVVVAAPVPLGVTVAGEKP